MLAVGVAVMSDVLDKSIRDPEQVASLFKTEVMGSLPQVRTWHRRIAPARIDEAGSTALVHADALGNALLTGRLRFKPLSIVAGIGSNLSLSRDADATTRTTSLAGLDRLASKHAGDSIVGTAMLAISE
jgi:hypothetical protein